MQKICAIIVLSALASNIEALPQTKWSRPVHNSQGQLTRERRQFPFGEWVPLSQPCPTCRQFADPLDVGLRGENIGLTPPRPPTVTRQIHNEGNFFVQDDESSILSVPPPPPSAIPRHPISNNNGNFQFSSFGQQFNTPLAIPPQKIFPQAQQFQFFPQTFSSNQPVLVNGNQQIPHGLKAQNNVLNQNQQQVTNFNNEFKAQKAPENVVLEQNKRPVAPKQAFSNKPQPFTSSQQNQQQNFVQQQAFGGQQQRLNFGNSILTPPPAPNNGTQNIVIPGLDKEEIQLLYVPVETLRQRGTPQEQLLTQHPQNIQFFNRGNDLQRPVSTVGPTEQTSTQPKGHFVTQNGKKQEQTDSTLKITSTQLFPTSVTPSNLLLQNLPFQQTPQPFVSATPATPTIQPFVTPASAFQKFSPFTPETTLSHLSTISDSIQFSQSDIEFGTTPKTISTQNPFKEEVITGKPLFSGLKGSNLNQELQRPLQQSLPQPFINQHQVVTQQPQLTTVFPQDQEKEIVTQSHFPHQINQQQISFQKQQEQQRLLQQQRQKELEEQRFSEQQRKQKELDNQRLLQQQQQQRQKELEQQKYLQKQKELEEQHLLQQQRQKELEQQRYLQKQKELEEQHLLQQQRQKELEQQRYLQKQKELEEQHLLQQQRQKELEQQRYLQKQKELEEQRLLQQQKQKELEQQRYLQKQKELEEQRLLQQQKQKELEQQRYLQKQKELEEQRLLQQQRQKELEQQRYLQKQKELEEHRLHQQRQKELEQQRFLQKQKELEEQRILQQRQKELDEQRFIQEQRQKELENQRRLQLQKQKELEDKRRLQLKQKEEEQRLLRFQQQQKELEHQRLLEQQQEEERRLLQQQKLQKQKQENLKKQQQFQFFQQQQQQQQNPNFSQQNFQQQNRHVLPANDNLNFIPQPEKEVEPEDQLIPHQPPLSVFFKGYNGAEPRITDVLQELRRSGTITVLDQYFEKMPKVFVGPAGLIPPPGYGKFELPYLSNLESNRIEKRIDKLPFFVAPLNFVPPPGYAKIPFPAPHVGSVVVSSESNPAMSLKTSEKGSFEEGSFPVVGPELPGLINNLHTETQTTTVKPTTYVSTPSLPQTTAQLRNRRPNTGLYKPQSRKPITRTRPTTTSKPEEEVTQPIQKSENSENGIRKPFNRFLNRRRQQAKTTTENPFRGQQDGKSLENRFYSVEVYHQDKNQAPKTQQKSDVISDNKNEENIYNQQFKQQGDSIDRITPSGHEVFEVRPTPGFSKISETGVIEQDEGRQDYADVNLQTFEDGPLPTGSAKTITQELYRPNTLKQPEGNENIKTFSKPDSIQTPGKYQPVNYEGISTAGFSEISDVVPTADLLAYRDSVSEGLVRAQPTSSAETEKDSSSERYDSTESSGVSFTPNPVTPSAEQQTPNGFFDSNEQYTSAFAEISKPHHIPGFTDSSKQQYSRISPAYPTPEISTDLQAPFSQKQYSQEVDVSSEIKPTQNSYEISNDKHVTTGSSNEQYYSGFEEDTKNQQPLEVSTIRVNPTATGTAEEQYSSFLGNQQAQNSREANTQSEDQRIGSFISLHNVSFTPDSPVSPHQYFPSSTSSYPSYFTPTEISKSKEYPVVVEQNQLQISSTAETVPEVTINPSAQTYTSASTTEGSIYVHQPTQTTEDHGQKVADNLPNDHRLKLPNPSIVRVRTRVRGKSRGQVNFAASQSTTPVPFTRSGAENKHNENVETEYTTKVNNFRNYQGLKTSKYNQYRGVKKPVRTTTEASAEYEQKTNVYTIRPQRKPLNPSTVSTKRIRRPTTPVPSAEAATEAFGLSTIETYSQSEHSDFSPSGVSNDVYYEQSSLSPVKHKLRKHFGSAEQKNDFVPSYFSTSYTTTPPTYSSFGQDSYSEESYVGKDFTQTAAPVENSERYPEWNPSESGFDVSGIVLTTPHSPEQEVQQLELEEPKKLLDSKKAFDPDLEKKAGRRRVRVRVHKRPHENFETAESQNLRTVANVLVPPTTTYKPNDESNIHQLAKNADFSFGGQKLFGLRSREYFKKRLNLTQIEGAVDNKEEERSKENVQDVGDSIEKEKFSGFVRKSEKGLKNDFDSVSTQSSENEEGNKFVRPKFRGFVRKIVKLGGASKEATSNSNQVHENDENEEGKLETSELHPKQQFRVAGFNHTRVNGTRQKTLVRFVKKNKIRHHEADTQNFQEAQKEELHQTTESHTPTPKSEQSTTEIQYAEVQDVKEEEKIRQSSEGQSSQQTEIHETEQPESTEKPQVEQTQGPPAQTTFEEAQSSSSQVPQVQTTSEETQETSSQVPPVQTTSEEVQASSFQVLQEPTSETIQPFTPSTVTRLSGLYLTQRPKFYQTLRPVFQRTTQSGFQRTREPEIATPTTEQTSQEPQEKRNGFARFKYVKTSSFSTTTSEKPEESKKVSEQHLKNKNLHTLEVRKYLRTKSREGAFSQFSKNKYFSSERTETVAKSKEENESEEITTEREVETSSSEPKTTQTFVARTDSLEVDDKTVENGHTDSLEVDDKTSENDNESELIVSTTEAISSSEEESSEEEVTGLDEFETTTEPNVQTTIFQTTSSETPENVTEPKISTPVTEETRQTEYQPDIYRFSENSFSFDETEKFTGTKNRAHVRNITTDIIENTASFSAPGVEKRPDIRVVTHRSDEIFPTVTESDNYIKKTEAITSESNTQETTTDYPETETTVVSADAVTKAKVAKILKTSTTTKISHETEICYRGKCIRTKSENPDEDLKLLVDSASTMKIEKAKT